LGDKLNVLAWLAFRISTADPFPPLASQANTLFSIISAWSAIFQTRAEFTMWARHAAYCPGVLLLTVLWICLRFQLVGLPLCGHPGSYANQLRRRQLL